MNSKDDGTSNPGRETRNTIETWGSHIPLFRTVCEFAKHDTIIECGIGFFSTPELVASCKRLFCIEHDPEWAQKVMQDIKGSEKVTLFTEPVPSGKKAIRAWLTGEELIAAERVYARLFPQLPHSDILFVDTFSGLRLTALQMLWQKADTIIIHDTEPRNYYDYCYDVFAAIAPHAGHYRYLPPGEPGSDLFISDSLDLAAFKSRLAVHHKDLYGKDGDFFLEASPSRSNL